MDIQDRLFAKVVKTNGCWNWTGATNGSGYGYISCEGKPIGVHRLSYILHTGPIPKGKHILHKCDNRRCVNPAHLYAGTSVNNANDRWKRNSRSSEAKKTTRFELRLSEQELQALSKLTQQAGLTSRSKWVQNQIRAHAKRKKVWQ